MRVMAKKLRDPDAMTGEQFAEIRGEHKLSQLALAGKIGVGLRTVIRFEAQANRKRDVPLDRACVADVAERYSIPVSTLYDMLDHGQLPSWRIGVRKRCTSWSAVRKFFGDVRPDPPALDA